MRISIRSSDARPIYEQIVEEIRRAIVQGELPPGAALPSMRVLATDLRVSLITTKRAYEELERLGLIESSVGRGSFVRSGEDHARSAKQAYRREALDALTQAVRAARLGGVPLEELQTQLSNLYQGDGKNGRDHD